MGKNIKLKGAKNIRDLGKIKAEDGIIKNGKILRGDALDKLTQKDVEILINKYNLKSVIDLRSTQEKMERPDIYCPQLDYIEIPIFDRRTPGITHEKGVNNGQKHINMVNLYKEVLTGEYLENVSKVIKTVMEVVKDGAVLYHCSVGKDRTGIITAILLAILGVDGEDIIEDYLYTNNVYEKKAGRVYWLIRFSDGDKADAEKTKNLMLAKEEYIEAAFGQINEQWGDFSNFVKNGLGIDDEMINEFRKNVVDFEEDKDE